MRICLIGFFCSLLACSSGASEKTTEFTTQNDPDPNTMPTSFISAPTSVEQAGVPEVPTPPDGPVSATTYPVEAPKTLEEAFGGADTLFPSGFSPLSLSWTAKDLVRERPWVINEGRLTPHLAYIYREAAYDAGVGRGDNSWLIENTIFGSIEYHFQRDQDGYPIGPLHKILFLFEVNLPKDAVKQIRELGDTKWGPHKTLSDQFQLSFDSWKPSGHSAEVIFRYSPGGSIAEVLEFINMKVPEIK